MAEPPLSELLLVLLSPLTIKRVYYLLMREPARSLGIWHPICAWLLQDPYVGTWFPLYRQVQVLRLCETKKIKQSVLCVLFSFRTHKVLAMNLFTTRRRSISSLSSEVLRCSFIYLFSQSAGRRSKILIIWYLSVDRNSLEKAYYVLLLTGKR